MSRWREREMREKLSKEKLLLLDKIFDDDMVMINDSNLGKVHGAMCFAST